MSHISIPILKKQLFAGLMGMTQQNKRQAKATWETVGILLITFLLGMLLEIWLFGGPSNVLP